MTQMLLMPDPRPIVERLGADFFRNAPPSPGVYLMRDAADTVVYVGKAKNLKQRLGYYRVANPDRLRRRHLKLLHSVESIEFETSPDESAAISREAELLLKLRPRFNRAGTWPRPARFVAWSLGENGLTLAVASSAKPRQRMEDGESRMESTTHDGDFPSSILDPPSSMFGLGALRQRDWHYYGPTGAWAFPLRAALVRLLWCVIQSERGLAAMPEGWVHGRMPACATIPCSESDLALLNEATKRLELLLDGNADGFNEWVRQHTFRQTHPFETETQEADLETITEFANKQHQRLFAR